MRAKYLLLLVVGVLIGMGLQGVLAKGDAKVTISGGDLPHDIEVTRDNFCVIDALSRGNLDNGLQVVRTPPDLQGDGYLVTRYDQLADGGYQPFDQLRFYFDPQGGYGYVHYLGMINQTSEQDDTWFRPTRQSQYVIETLLTQARANR